MRNVITEILDFLFVGRYQDSINDDSLKALGITHILNVMDSSKFHEDSPLKRFHVPISDYGETDLITAADKCCDIIEAAHSDIGKVLLHCGRGQNRSPSIATAYLMKMHDMPLKEAFHFVRDRRTQFAPHEAYFAQLQQLDERLFGTLSLTEDEEPLSIQQITRKIAQDSNG